MSSSRSPSTMRAWQYEPGMGKLEAALKLSETLPVPKPRPDQHLVEVIAASLNPVDYKVFEIPLLSSLMVSRPATPGLDVAGRVVVPAAGSSLQPGDLVFGGAAKKPFVQGMLAEFVILEKDSVATIPSSVDPTALATVQIAGLTAYQSIAPYVKRGDRIFINGGSGGTGTFGIQIAKALGCYVTTTCSAVNAELCQRLGADEVIDYRSQDVVQTLKGRNQKFSHVVDNVYDPSLYFRAHEFTEINAKYIMVGGGPYLSFVVGALKMLLWPSVLGGGKRKLRLFLPNFNPEDLTKIAAMMETGAVRPIIDSQFPFEEAPQAYTKLRSGRSKGKVIVVVQPPK